VLLTTAQLFQKLDLNFSECF